MEAVLQMGVIVKDKRDKANQQFNLKERDIIDIDFIIANFRCV